MGERSLIGSSLAHVPSRDRASTATARTAARAVAAGRWRRRRRWGRSDDRGRRRRRRRWHRGRRGLRPRERRCPASARPLLRSRRGTGGLHGNRMRRRPCDGGRGRAREPGRKRDGRSAERGREREARAQATASPCGRLDGCGAPAPLPRVPAPHRRDRRWRPSRHRAARPSGPARRRDRPRTAARSAARAGPHARPAGFRRAARTRAGAAQVALLHRRRAACAVIVPVCHAGVTRAAAGRRAARPGAPASHPRRPRGRARAGAAGRARRACASPASGSTPASPACLTACAVQTTTSPS